MTAGMLNFFLPGIEFAYLIGLRFGLLGVLAWASLLVLQLLAFTGSVIPETTGVLFWLIVVLFHNSCAGILAAALARAVSPRG